MLEDLRFTFRTLARRPWSTAFVIAVLGLGLGAATAAFSVVDKVLLRPLPYGAPDQLVALWETSVTEGLGREPTSVPNFVDWKTMNTTFSGVAAYADWLPIANGQLSDEQLTGAQVTAGFFDVLQVSALAGRVFDQNDMRPGAPGTVLISYAEWMHRFGGAAVRDLSLRLGGQPYQVIGVLPPSFRQPGPTVGNRPVQVWRPFPVRVIPTSRRWDSLEVIGRLKPARSIEDARSDMGVLSARLAAQYPEANAAFKIVVAPLRESLAEPIRKPLLMLFYSVLMLLAITWLNLANMIAARSLERETEFAIRGALGGSAWRRFRLLLAENVALGLGAAVAGIGIAFLAMRAVALQASRWVAGAEQARIDARLLLACLGGALLMAPLFAGISLLVMRRSEGALHVRGVAASRRISRLRSALVIAEILLTVGLLTTGGALLREFVRLDRTVLGYDTENIVTAQVQLPPLAKPGNPRDARSGAFLRDLVANVGSLPGVEAAAAVDAPPLLDRGASLEFLVEGLPRPAPDKIQSAETHLISPGYFRASGTPVIAGRVFGPEDRLDMPLTVIVNHYCVAHYFGGMNPLGRRVSLKVPTGPGPWRTVVGEVADVRFRTLTDEPKCQIYMPHEQEAWPSMALLIKTNLDPATLAPSLYRVLRRMDPTRPLYNIRTDEDLRRAAMASRRFSLALVLAVGLVSLVVALTGVYGVMSFAVARRTAEVGVRMSVGARPGDIMLMFLRGSAGMAIAGLIGGLLLIYAASTTIQHVVEGVKVFDAAICTAVCLAVFGCVLLASYIPARRASSIDPAAALRHE